MLIGLGLAVLWIGGMATGQPIWASWLNFAFAVAFLGVAASALVEPRMVHARHTLRRRGASGTRAR
jgi:hypothetical protein